MKTALEHEHDRDLREQDRKLKSQKREMCRALITEQVLHRLGEPTGLIQVQVRRLWEDRYRVNVFVGAGVTSATIANSYFLVCDSDGNIIEATPTIRKQYSRELAQ